MNVGHCNYAHNFQDKMCTTDAEIASQAVTDKNYKVDIDSLCI